MIQSALISSEETTIINNNFKDEVSVVDIEVDELATKLEQYGALGRFMISASLCNCKAGQHLDDAFISVSPTKAMTSSTEDITDDSDTEVEKLNDFDVSGFDAEETLEKYFASSSFVKSEYRIDGKYLSKV